MANGFFITLEGVEGGGKTTQAAILADTLRAEGHAVEVTHEPGDTAAGKSIRQIFLDPSVRLERATELLLVLADRAQHVSEKIKPALASGKIVISDRYSDSTTAYQGYGRGFDLELLGGLNRLASDNLLPDLTIVLDLDADAGLKRTYERGKAANRGADRFESERAEFHRKVRDGFLAIARAERARVIVIDAAPPVAQVSSAILSAVRPRLPK